MSTWALVPVKARLEGKQRLAEYMRKSDPNFSQMVEMLEHPENV